MKQYIFLLSLILIFPLNSINSQWVFWGFAAGVGSTAVISTPNCSTLVIAGGTTGQPKILASTNNGPLIDITGNITGAELYCVWAKNRDTIFAGDGGSPGGAGGNAKVWRTVNGGINWSVILTTGGSAGFINGIVFERPVQRFGVIFSDPPAGAGLVWYAKTNNGGMTWTTHSMIGGIGVANSVFCVDSLLFGFAPNISPPGINYTTNGGSSWYTQTLTGISGITSGIAFSNNKLNGIAGSNTMASTISRTTNGGATWFAQSIGGGVTGYCRMKWIWGSNSCLLSGTAGAGGCIKKSTDAGATWSTMTTASFTGIAHFDANREVPTGPFGTAIIADGSLIKLACQPIGIGYSNNIPKTYELLQNYPNPFNPVTIIEFAIPKPSNVSIRIHNVLGEEVAVLYEGFLIAGRYSVDYNASEMTSGIYFYTLTTEGFTATKKMTLVK